jgi:hypothetical protein
MKYARDAYMTWDIVFGKYSKYMRTRVCVCVCLYVYLMRVIIAINMQVLIFCIA